MRLTSGVGILSTALQLILGIIISAFFLATGEKILEPIRSTTEHLLGKKDGDSLLAVITQAIKGVSIGIMGTAFIASVIAWIGLWIAGIEYSLVLGGVGVFPGADPAGAVVCLGTAGGMGGGARAYGDDDLPDHLWGGAAADRWVA